MVLRFLGTVLGWAVGLAFAVVAIVTDLPMLLLILFSSFAGASVAVSGIGLTFGVVDSADFDEAALRSSVRENWS